MTFKDKIIVNLNLYMYILDFYCSHWQTLYPKFFTSLIEVPELFGLMRHLNYKRIIKEMERLCGLEIE